MADHDPATRGRWWVEVVVSTAVLGVVVGVAWVWLAPDLTGRVVETADGLDAVIDGDQAALLFAREAVLLCLLAAAGVVQGALLFLRHRRRGAVVAVAVAAAGLVGAAIAWRVGVLLGPSAVDDLAGLSAGQRLPVPLQVEAWGVLAGWSIAGLVVVLVLNAWLVEPPARLSPPRSEPSPPL